MWLRSATLQGPAATLQLQYRCSTCVVAPQSRPNIPACLGHVVHVATGIRVGLPQASQHCSTPPPLQQSNSHHPIKSKNMCTCQTLPCLQCAQQQPVAAFQLDRAADSALQVWRPGACALSSQTGQCSHADSSHAKGGRAARQAAAGAPHALPGRVQRWCSCKGYQGRCYALSLVGQGFTMGGVGSRKGAWRESVMQGSCPAGRQLFRLRGCLVGVRHAGQLGRQLLVHHMRYQLGRLA